MVQQVPDSNLPTTPEADTDLSNDGLRQSIEAELENKSWLETFKVAVETYDQYYLLLERSKTITNAINTKQKETGTIDQRLKEIQSRLSMYQRSVEQFSDHQVVLSTQLRPNLLRTDLWMSDQETDVWDLANKIAKLLEQGQNEEAEITIKNPEMVELIKSALPTLVATLSTDLSKQEASLEEQHLELEKLNQQLQETQIDEANAKERLKITIELLDEKEIVEGAPEYAVAEEGDEKKYQSYLDRIAWRREQYNAQSWHKRVSGRREFSRKWAIFVAVDGVQRILNPGRTFDDVFAHTLLLNRVPEPTIAIYSEGLHVSGKISVKETIQNGIIQPTTSSQRNLIANQLIPDIEHLRRGIYERD